MALVTPSGGASGVSSQTLLSDTTLAVDGNFDVQSISQAFNDLILVFTARSAAATAADAINVRFNADSGNNYNAQFMQAGGATVSGANSGAVAQIQTGTIPGASDNASLFGAQELVIPGYTSTAFFKMMFVRAAHDPTTAGGTSMQNFQQIGYWLNTAAITRVTTLLGSAGNILAGSRLRIYGRL